MTEAGDLHLDTKRFHLGPESITGIDNLKRTFLELRQQYPFLSGIGFFGSRVKGREHSGSDYDVCIFYNSERINSLNVGTRSDWEAIIDALQNQVNTGLDSKLAYPSAGLRVDLSKETIDKQIEMFVEHVEPHVNKEIDENLTWRIIIFPPTQDLYMRFILAIGKEVYQSRKYILDRFKEMPDGEKYFLVLMKCLGLFEVGNKKGLNSNKYPKTLEQAEHYFLVR